MNSYSLIERLRDEKGYKNDLAVCKELNMSSGRMSEIKGGKKHLNPLEIDRIGHLLGIGKAARYDLLIEIERERDSRKGFIERAMQPAMSAVLAIFFSITSTMLLPTNEAHASVMQKSGGDRGIRTLDGVFDPMLP